MRMNIVKLTGAPCLVASILLLSCVSPQVELLDEGDGSASDERTRWMDIRVENWDGSVSTGEFDGTPQAVASYVLTHCDFQVATTPSLAQCSATPTNSCSNNVICPALEGLCAALTLREMAAGVVSVELVDGAGNPVYRIPPQDPESQAALEQAAQVQAQIVLSKVAGGFASTSTCDDVLLRDPVGTHEGAPGETAEQSRGELLASTLVEALAVGEAAAERGARVAVGVADRDLAGTDNRGRAARLGWFDRNLSRLIAVQSHVGGLDVMPTSGHALDAQEYRQDPTETRYPQLTEIGIGSQPPCRGDCDTALALLRMSGAPLEAIVDDPVVDGSGVSLTSLLQEVVTPRLAERYSLPVDGFDEIQLAQHFEISPNDFRQARTYLIHQAAAFSRPFDYPAEIPPLRPLADGTVPTPLHSYDRATMADPVQPPAMHYITAARASGMWNGATGITGVFGDPNDSAAPLARPGRAYLFDVAHATALRAIASDRVDATTEAGRRTQGVLATIVQDGVARRAARVEVCGIFLSPTQINWRVRAFGVDPNDAIMVAGTDMLRCAVDGEIEREACQLTSPVPNVAAGTVPAGSPAGFTDFAEWTFDTDEHVETRPYWYVVRRREGRAGSSPGAFVPVAGIPWAAPNLQTNAWACVTLPFDEISYSAASESLRVDPNSEPREICGEPRGPIPLEDEIIDDGDPYETSWRHHLTVASRASAHADEMGQRLLQSGLAIDQVAQSSMDRVVELCGTSFNLEGLFNADGSTGEISLEELILGTACTGAGTCPDGYNCVGTSCVSEVFIPSDASRFEIEALSRCLGLGSAAENIETVALGSTPLCAWYTTDPEILCDGAESGDCPYPRPSEGCGSPPMGATSVEIDETLNLLPRGAEGADPISEISSARLDCNILRRLRNEDRLITAADSADFTALLESDFFRYENVRHWAERIGWWGNPLDFSEVRVDGEVWRTTGYPFEGDSRTAGPAGGAWPCAAEPGAACPAGSNSLFCETSADCSTQLARVDINHRMGRAAVTLTALAGLGLSNHRLPIHILDWDDFDYGSIDGGVGERNDYHGHRWRRALDASFGRSHLSGLIVFPLQTPVPNDVVWHSVADDGLGLYEEHFLTADPGSPHGVSHARPFGFVDMGTSYEDDDDARARAIARTLWAGLRSTVPERTSAHESGEGIAHDFWGTIDGYDSRDLATRELLHRSVVEAFRRQDAVLMDGRIASGQVHQLTHLFREPAHDVAIGETLYRRNHAHLFESPREGANFFRRDLLDAMELMCQVAATQPTGSLGSPTCERPTGAINSGDVGSVQRYFDCIADRLDHLGQRQFVQNVPREVVDALRGESSDHRPDVGRYGELITDLRVALRAQAAYPRAVAEQIRGANDDIEALKSALRSVTRGKVIAWLGQIADAMSTVATCANWSNFGSSCGVAAAHLTLAASATVLESENLDDQAERAVAAFRLSIQSRFDALATLEEALLSGGDSLDAVLARLRSTQRGAQSAVAQAAFAESDAAGRQYSLNTAMRRSYDINLLRYQDAHAAAVRSALVARRAIEQRFGVDLEEQACASLVDPPNQWAGDICNAQGINYAALRDPDAPEPTPESVRAMFVGDYVRRLEQYVESYRFDYPYTSSEDSTVFSMRDDAATVRGACIAEADNLLGVSNDLVQPELPSETGGLFDLGGAPGWYSPVAGCTTSLDSETGESITHNCVEVGAADSPGAVGSEPGSPPRGWRVTFAPNSDIPGTVVDYTDDAAWLQDVELPSGLYRLSWYAHAGGDIAPEAAVTAVYEGASAYVSPVFREIPADELVPGSSEQGTGDVLNPGWSRYFQLVDVDTTASTVVVSIGIQAPDLGVAPSAPRSVDVAGVQLEDVTGTVATRTSPLSLTQSGVDAEPHIFYPTPFVATTSQGFARFSQCLTTDPADFRDRWRYACERLCAGGFDRCTEGEAGEMLCFWELMFTLDEDRLLAQGDELSGGFAFGNFNYRSGTVAVNVVGTGVRRCGGPDSRSCFGDGSVPFSIEHSPLVAGSGGGTPTPNTYWVRTHGGDLHPVELFRGRIEQGRALAAERYLTNPLSSADRALLLDYQHPELRGRPLSGNYVLRLWDTGSIDFSRVEDVQVSWQYRYFTRTDESSCGG